MFTQIRLNNFKSFERTSVDLKRINILIGPNGAGKSAILQSLLMWAQSIERTELLPSDPRGAMYGLIDLGAQSDVLKFGSREGSVGFAGRSGLSNPPLLGRIGEILFSCDASIGTEEQKGTFYLESASLRYGVIRSAGDLKFAPNSRDANKIALNRDLPSLSAVGAVPSGERAGFDRMVNAPTESLRGIRYVPPLRGSGVSRYELQNAGKNDLIRGLSVDESASDLATTLTYDDDLARAVSEMIVEVTGVRIRTSVAEQKRTAVVSSRRSSNGDDQAVLPTNEGFGTNQLVFLLTQLLLTPAGGTVLIEEPEIHLHPGAQTELGRILAQHAHSEGKQIIATTHSEAFLEGILGPLRLGAIESSDVTVQYVAPDAEQGSTVHSFEIGRAGIAATGASSATNTRHDRMTPLTPPPVSA